MIAAQKDSRSARYAWFIPVVIWAAVVAILFGLGHPVLAGHLWLVHLGAVLVNILIVLSATVLGHRILVWLDALPSRAGERFITALGAGLLALTLATLGVGLAGGLYRWVGWLLILIPIGICFRDARALFKDGADLVRETPGPDWGSTALGVLCLPILAAGLWLALAPVSAHDVLVYHLQIPKHYAGNHSISSLPYNVYSNMPHNLEVLSTLAFLTGGEAAAGFLDPTIRFAVAAATFILAHRYLPARASILAVLLLLLNPVVTSARTIGNIDLGMALFFLLAVMALLRFLEEDRARDLWLVALFAGYLMGCKYTGLFLALSLIAVLLIARRPLEGRAWIATSLLLAAPVFPWLLKNLVMTGNPVYPLLSSTFSSREWDPLLGKQLIQWQRSMGMGRSFADYFVLPWNIAVEGQMGRNYRFFDGIISPLPLAFIPLIVLIRNRTAWLRLLGLCVIPFVGWAVTSQQVRFLIPLLPLLGVITAGVIWTVDEEGLRSGRRFFRMAGVALVIAFLIVFQLPPTIRNVARALPVVTGEISKDEHLAEVLQPYGVLKYANETLPPTARVLMIWENSGYYMDRPYIADSFFEASQVAQLAARSGSPASFADDLRTNGITHVIYNHGLGSFFETLYGPQYATFLRTFVADHLEEIYSERDVTLYQLR